VDIDHFKRVNDGYGHDAGDEVLRSIGRAVGASVRTIDLAARFGGEEIAILLPKTGLEGARELAERLRREIANHPVQVRNESLRVTASFGVACYPESSSDQRALFTNADAALYEAKAAGRNQVKCARQHEASATFIEMI
jgi:diguanylate cyclase (GGDEF)-like protein